MFDLIGVIFPFYAYPYLSILICVGIVLIEIKSVWEHAKRRKSKVGELPDIIDEVIKVASKPEAEAVLNKFKEYLNDDGKKE